MQTDHKPLLAIFGSKIGVKVHTAKRLYHWSTLLSAYSFEMEYINTEAFGYADALSRLIASSRSEVDEDEDILGFREVEKTVCNAVTNCIDKMHVSLRRSFWMQRQKIRYFRRPWSSTCHVGQN